MEAKALKEAKERQERERIRLLEEEEEKKRKEEEAERERERQRQLEQERLAELQKRNEEARRFQQQQQEEERRLKEQQASMEAIHEQQRNIQPQTPTQQQVWSVMFPQPISASQPIGGGASLIQIQQQEEARYKKQQVTYTWIIAKILTLKN